MKITDPNMPQESTGKERPLVHLVASSRINQEGSSKFFEPIAENWKNDKGFVPAENIPIFKGLMDSLDKDAGDTEALVEMGGRLCYMSFNNPSGRTNEQYIQNIKKQMHFSVLEHGTASFIIENVDRALTHELIRHRHLSPSELSQRYVDRASAQFVVPPLYRNDSYLQEMYLNACRDQLVAYNNLVHYTEKRHPGLSRKQVREAARRVLPEGTETKIMMTGNMRSWLEMLSKRYSTHADASILELAEEILIHLKKLAPSIFSDVELQTN